jgi:hypothetical protein
MFKLVYSSQNQHLFSWSCQSSGFVPYVIPHMGVDENDPVLIHVS